MEQDVILTAVASIKSPGYVLDLGANDGVSLSNSRALIELGWHGCMVEPDYEAFGKLAALYRKNPNVKLIQAAVDTEGGFAAFHKSSSGGLVSSLNDTAHRGEFQHDYVVGKIRPSDIVNLIPRGPDVITVDIEGRSFDVLCQFPFGSWEVRVICVEHDGRTVEISGWGNEHGYRVVELNAENLIMVKRA